jgi:DNA-binding MarR family transcriptional regulator
MNGKNSQQRIVSILALTKEPLRRETIARQLGISPDTAAKALTSLKQAGLINETNGYWSITPEGKELHETNPNFSLFHTKGNGDSRENWAELLGPETINNPLGRSLLQEISQELLATKLPVLRFFVLCWLRAEGITVNFNGLEPELPSSEAGDEAYFILEKLYTQNENK